MDRIACGEVCATKLLTCSATNVFPSARRYATFLFAPAIIRLPVIQTLHVACRRTYCVMLPINTRPNRVRGVSPTKTLQGAWEVTESLVLPSSVR